MGNSTNAGENTSYRNSNSIENEWQLLQVLEEQAETSQADLAVRAGIAVGTVNWYLKRWANKGYIKIKRIDRWRWSYLLTPQGVARKATLTKQYVEASMSLYRRTRDNAKEQLTQMTDAGYATVYIDGQGEIAEICHLTCLEMGIHTLSQSSDTDSDNPVLSIEGATITIHLPNSQSA